MFSVKNMIFVMGVLAFVATPAAASAADSQFLDNKSKNSFLKAKKAFVMPGDRVAPRTLKAKKAFLKAKKAFVMPGDRVSPRALKAKKAFLKAKKAFLKAKKAFNKGNKVGLIDEIKEDDEVEFELKEGRKGMNAVNVQRTD